MADEVRYEFKSVQAIRGTEARSIRKWQTDGWELVDQKQGTLRTSLEFRRPKPKVSRLPLIALGAVALLVAGSSAIVSAIHGGDQSPSSSMATTVASGTASPSPQDDASGSSQSQQDQVLTVANSKDLANVLAVPDSCDESVGLFAEKYEGEEIEFDGSIVNFVNHGDYDTRYDILLGPGDKGPETTVGPALKFENVNDFDLNFGGSGESPGLAAGDRLRFDARVGGFNPTQCLLFLDPVSTEVR